jgi:hypothetical protein
VIKRRFRQFAILIPMLVLCGCGTGDSMRLAREGETRVHQQMNAEQFAEIYAQADPTFRGATSSQEFLDFMAAVHRKLGNEQSAAETGYFVNFTTSGTRVRLNYKTKFDGGEAEEEFVWAVSGEKAALMGYHINSTTLILK